MGRICKSITCFIYNGKVTQVCKWSKSPIYACIPLSFFGSRLPCSSSFVHAISLIFFSFFWKYSFAKTSWLIPNSHTLPCVGKGNPKVSNNSKHFLLLLFYLFNTYLSYIMAKLIDSSLITFHFCPWCLPLDKWPPSCYFWNPLCACSWFPTFNSYNISFHV